MHKIKEFLRKLLQRTKPASAEVSAFIATANEEMLAQQVEHAATWKYGKEKGWTADLTAGVIAFKFANGRTGTSQFQTIGIYHEQESSFVWAWAQTTLPPTLRGHAKLAKQWGGAQGQAAFSRQRVTCSMDEAWSFAAVTRKLAGANSVYRGRVGNRYIFMTIDKIQFDESADAANSTLPTMPFPLEKSEATKSPESHWSKGRRSQHW